MLIVVCCSCLWVRVYVYGIYKNVRRLFSRQNVCFDSQDLPTSITGYNVIVAKDLCFIYKYVLLLVLFRWFDISSIPSNPSTVNELLFLNFFGYRRHGTHSCPTTHRNSSRNENDNTSTTIRSDDQKVSLLRESNSRPSHYE